MPADAVVALIEQVMIFALGFLTAGLLALLFLPAFWRRAVRLSTRRLEMLMPLSMDEVIAERDGVRAEAAMRERRLEQKIETMNIERAGQMAEIGRRMARIAERDADLSKLQAHIEEVQRDLTSRNTEIERLSADLATSQQDVVDLTARLSSSDEAGRALQDVEKALRHEIDQYRTVIAGLETKLAGLEVLQGDLGAQLKKAQLHAADQESALRNLRDERDFLKKEFETAAQRRDMAMNEQQRHGQELQTLQDELHHERRMRLRLEAEGQGTSALSPQEEQALRKVISDMGAQILTLSQELNEARQREEPLDERIRSLRERIKQVAG